MYPEEMTKPMEEELTSQGITALKSSDAVVTHFTDNKEGTTLLVVNSVCGCAALNARPGVLLSLEKATKKPQHTVTVFAGVDIDATTKAREYIVGYPPSSPSVALFKDGQVVEMIERHRIEGRSAQEIADDLLEAYEKYC